MAKGNKIGSVFGRALGVAITYVVIGSMWGQMTGFLNSANLGGLNVLAQIGLGLFVAILPFVAFAPEIKSML